MSESVLDVNHLFWQVEGKTILADIHFNLPQGQMLGLIGPNGAGKSSLLRCLYRYILPSGGNIDLFGKDLTAYSPKALARTIAVVQQDTPHYFDLTTEQLVTMGLTPHKGLFDATTSDDKALIEQALSKVGLIKHAHQPYEQLSGGEKQRALIARAIVQQPQILILDEPTNHLDIRYQIQILELVASLGISVIASIHDLNLASAMCDKLLLLDKGKLIAKGHPTQVLTERQISDVFGVCCEVNSHPQHHKPLISYFYGYQTSNKEEINHD
ncbi:ABC transporter ATP-binding protein [Shewanella inventionis]|uniref:ABC cobalamin uptake system ATPase BtuD n=1 Tax=Shewanella inventionis TaxID=1738770 RepID=A0ABQ1JT41_9GAMM|nr:ABC transporter ATP-binding protein [Shewanella inventionis]MCL1159869.1 ABC transporter ATP-binding protein [Shewanella inventionis]UAL44566.1 ABC transporter ATP-binding protein [Shewanella inventionis]GGB75730.1 ABC cobalamin uptake system ATPase BtuD [Shewanella inventionis]